VRGDDQIIGDPGLQLPTRLEKFGSRPPQHGLMLAARFEHLQESVKDERATSTTTGAAAPAAPAEGSTEVDSLALGVNYWFSRRFRASINYIFNSFGGDAPAVRSLPSVEHELAFRLAIAL
jgi:hypothetical protein